MKLSELEPGEHGRVLEIQSPELQLALLRMGLLPGDTIQLSERAPWGGPMAFWVNGTKVAMRKHQAAKVTIEKC